MNVTTNKKSLITKWVNDFSDELYQWAYYKTSDEDTAKDIVQDTLMAAYKGFDNFKNNAEPKTWLFSILNHKIAQFYRTKYKFNTISFEQDEFNIFDSNGKWKVKENIKWVEDENLLDDFDFKKTFKKCLEGLPELWRIVVNLKYIENKKGSEICGELDLSESNYWQLIHRSKLKLRQCLNINWFKTI